MCIWKQQPTWDEVVPASKPRTAYKAVTFRDTAAWYETPRMRFYSAFAYRTWRKAKRPTMHAARSLLDWTHKRLGVFAFDTKKGAEHYNATIMMGRGMVVRLEVWGRVVSHMKETGPTRLRHEIPAGVRAEHARIVEVWIKQERWSTDRDRRRRDALTLAKQVAEAYPGVLINVSGRRVRPDELEVG